MYEGRLLVHRKELHVRPITAITFFNPLKYLITGAMDGCSKYYPFLVGLSVWLCVVYLSFRLAFLTVHLCTYVSDFLHSVPFIKLVCGSTFSICHRQHVLFVYGFAVICLSVSHPYVCLSVYVPDCLVYNLFAVMHNILKGQCGLNLFVSLSSFFSSFFLSFFLHEIKCGFLFFFSFFF